MLYLSERDLHTLGIDWNETISSIDHAVRCLDRGDFAQPIKPYLRYRNPVNRIIAMPAFLGGDVNAAGIKWIASFPGNLDRQIPRAHSVVVVNDADTGAPICIVNGALLSVIRTASVSGLLLRLFDQLRTPDEVKVGITGFGPIGRYHLAMCQELLGARLRKVSIYDPRSIDLHAEGQLPEHVGLVRSWQEAYDDADVFITCTVSSAPYIDRPAKPGSLQLNVSLRDYTVHVFDQMKDAMIVDDWDEVNREATDIEVFHKEKGLTKEGTKSIVDVVCHGALAGFAPAQPILFNPMGMAVFDIAIARHFHDKARAQGVGTTLD
ncbi:ornithine cyclodeaminase [Chondromyces crocatus]|uniref:Ornithine cyclodeaminase n=1 Tax=Chondromyces crocatus TaxID=52 RepID=A0A0K1EJ52_CHOCO|nr:ornithine cyclodeaminase [Chondromyces crocatus]AKT40697.1 ornithine cyclodeaminase [Chondromyces crocatus]